MKLKLLILLTFFEVVNIFSQYQTATLTIPSGTYTPDSSGNMTFETGTLTHEGATFTLKVTIAAKSSIDGEGASTTLIPQGIMSDGTTWAVTYTDPNMIIADDNAISFDADFRDEATVSSIVVTNFIANDSGYTAVDITEIHFKSIAVNIANNKFDRVEFYINDGDLVNLGKLPSSPEVITFEDEYVKADGSTVILSNEAVTAFRLSNNFTNQSSGNRISAGEIIIAYKFELSTTWTGANSSVWTDTGNWSNGLPTASVDAIIPSGLTNQPVINSAVAVNNLSVNAASTLTVASGGSLIVNGSSSGEVIYKRTLTSKAGDANGWHLISSPVAGQIYNNNYATTNNLATSTTDNTRRGLATFNDANDPKFDYLLTNDNNAGTFISGIGYSAKRGSGGQIIFEGTINTADVNDVAVSASADGYVLLGVPYTSYTSSKTFLEANTNLDQSQIWVWEQGDPTGGNYIAEIAANDFKLAPGQGFFVKKANTVATVDFAKSNQTSNDTDTFKKSSKTEVKLLLSDGENNRFAKLNYADNVTKGFDTGWEGETFGGVKNSFDVFSQLVEDNNGKNYQVQSLPISEMESMIVPLGVKAAANKEIIFSATSLNLPSGVKVVIEDRANNVFTNLDEGNYKITLTEAADGVGRFYLHTSSKSALSVDNNAALNSISIYKSSATTLKIAGLSQGNAKVNIFNILGKKVFNTSFKVNTTVKNIALPDLSTGVYIVQLQTATGRLNKKIILE
ncbi:T9SS type A sorting domain-containing protein [Polaribacter sp.]|nr:T9SS type A sorting domain-containing protein [Polaribacter sp.]